MGYRYEVDVFVLASKLPKILESLLSDWIITSAQSPVEHIVKYLQGHPQCRKKVTIVGLPLRAGISSFKLVGALSPMFGALDVSTATGVIHEAHSCWKVMVRGFSYRIIS